MCWLPDGGASYVGLQRIDGSIGERKGSLVIRSAGRFDGASSKGSWEIVEGSGIGDLEGITGEGGFEAPGGPNASYSLEYRLP